MEIIIKILKSQWIMLSILFSLFWGVRSVYFFTTNPAKNLTGEQSSRFPFLRICPCLGGFFIASYQFVFNFVGSFAGWCCLYVLLVRIEAQTIEKINFSGGDVLLFIGSLLGITGHLPQALLGFVESFSKIAEKATDKLSK